MSPSNSAKSQAAEERSAKPQAFVRRMRAVTRQSYTLEEKIRIVLEGFRREVTALILECRVQCE